MNKTIGIISILALNALPAFADLNNSISYQTKKPTTLETIKSNLSFGYFMNFLGPSLSRPENGPTYNRFNSGNDYFGNKLDATDNTNYFNSLSLTYQVKQNFTVGYSYAWDETFNNGASYKWKSKQLDGSFKTFESDREPTRSDYNQRLNLFFGNIYEGKSFYLSTGFSYEMPTSEVSQDNEMLYGLILNPTIAFKSETPGLFYGVTAQIQRDYYQNNSIFVANCDSCYPNEMQTMRTSVGHYLNYMISDKWTFQNTTNFDWDQRGIDTETNRFSNNMDDVIRFGFNYRTNKVISLGPYTQAVLFDPRLETTVVGFTFGMTI
jgi:hypothetical protein